MLTNRTLTKQSSKNKPLKLNMLDSYYEEKDYPKTPNVNNLLWNCFPSTAYATPGSQSQKYFFKDSPYTPLQNRTFKMNYSHTNEYNKPVMKQSKFRLKTIKKEKTIQNENHNSNTIKAISSSNKRDVEVVIRQALEDNRKKKHNRYELEKDFLKYATDSKGKLVSNKNKSEMKFLNNKIGEIKKKIRLVKRVFDYTCPLLFIAKNSQQSRNKALKLATCTNSYENVIKANHKYSNKVSNKNNNNKPIELSFEDDQFVPLASLYSKNISSIYSFRLNKPKKVDLTENNKTFR